MKVSVVLTVVQSVHDSQYLACKFIFSAGLLHNPSEISIHSILSILIACLSRLNCCFLSFFFFFFIFGSTIAPILQVELSMQTVIPFHITIPSLLQPTVFLNK